MRQQGRSRGFAGALLAGVVLAACGGGAPGDRNEGVQSRVALKAFEDCSALEQYIEDTAVSQNHADLTALKVNAVAGGWWGGWGRNGGISVGAPPDGAAEDKGQGAGPVDHSTTNTQVEGVDEADFVKNDGERIFVLTGNRLYATRSWPPEALSLEGSLQVEGWPHEMFLAEDRVVVFSGVSTPAGDVSGGQTQPGGMAMDEMSWGYHLNSTKVTTVDVSNLGAPKVVGEMYLPGSYVSSRRVGARVRLVLRDHFRYLRDVQFYPTPPEGGFKSTGDFVAAVDKLMAENEARIRKASLEQWLPEGKRRVGGELVEMGYRCQDFHASNAPTRLGLASVVTFNPGDASTEVRRTAVVGEVGQVYASATSLYLASSHWWRWPEPGQTDATYLHKLDISQPDSALYVASGVVDGHINHQFSLDEHQGFLRVATTISRIEPDPESKWGRVVTTNRVTVLGEQDGRLLTQGQTPELAPGERIFAVRFIGARGFLVTFRQVDPLFSLDLSDPANPRVAGELKIPGFSTYLHPVDANHLLGVGEDRDEDGNWATRRLKVSLYDVSNPAEPREKFKYLLGSSSSSSEANWSHKAFNYFASKKLLAVPFTDWSSQSVGNVYESRLISNLKVLGVDVNQGFTLQGELTLGDMYPQEGQNGTSRWSHNWQPWVRRSVMATDVSGATYAYAIADAGIRVAKVDSLSVPVATVRFPEPQQ